MIEVLNRRPFDNERNILNADLFVSNLKHTLKAFQFSTKITYTVYRNITIYNIKWNDDKTYQDIIKLKKEISLSLGITPNELNIEKISDNEVQIKALNKKRVPLTLRELLELLPNEEENKIPLGLNEEDEPISFDLTKDKNLLVTGVTGTGKTNLFNVLILELLMQKERPQIILLDSQKVSYNNYKELCEVVTDKDKIINRIREIRTLFEERVKNKDRSKIIIFIDEIYLLVKEDITIKDDINYLLELGSTMNIHLIISTDSILDDDINYLFDKDDISKVSFYLTTRGEYNKFLDEYINTSLGNDCMYLSINNHLERLSIPLLEDDEIERVINKVKE